MFNDTPAWKTNWLLGVYITSLDVCVCGGEEMNECLMTPQHGKQIGYWVSEQGKCMKWLSNE